LIEKNNLKKRLLELIKKDALFFTDVKLSSGKKSDYYIDGRRITLTREGVWLVAKIVFDIIREDNVQAIGGPTIGADPIIGAVILLGHLNSYPLQGFLVRKEPKEHGMQRYIEGPSLKEGMRVAIVDDVVTTGSSILRVAQAVREKKCNITRIIAIVDREEGAEEILKKHGLYLTAIFKKDQLNISPKS